MVAHHPIEPARNPWLGLAYGLRHHLQPGPRRREHRQRLQHAPRVVAQRLQRALAQLLYPLEDRRGGTQAPLQVLKVGRGGERLAAQLTAGHLDRERQATEALHQPGRARGFRFGRRVGAPRHTRQEADRIGWVERAERHLDSIRE